MAGCTTAWVRDRAWSRVKETKTRYTDTFRLLPPYSVNLFAYTNLWGNFTELECRQPGYFLFPTAEQAIATKRAYIRQFPGKRDQKLMSRSTNFSGLCTVTVPGWGSPKPGHLREQKRDKMSIHDTPGNWTEPRFPRPFNCSVLFLEDPEPYTTSPRFPTKIFAYEFPPVPVR